MAIRWSIWRGRRSPKVGFLQELGLDASRPVVALLPGSRPNEVERLLPVMRDAVARIHARLPEAQFVIARAPALDDRLFSNTKWNGVQPIEVLARTDDVLAIADVAVTASGTATVQAALHGRPMVVIYRLSPVTYRLGRRFLLVDNVAMVNLIAGTPHRARTDSGRVHRREHRGTRRFHFSPIRQRAAETRRALGDVRARLGGPGASGRAAEAVLELARRTHT